MKRKFALKPNNGRGSLEDALATADATLDASTGWLGNRLSMPGALIPVPSRRLLRVRAAARYLGISDDTLRKYADIGLIQAYRFSNGHRVFKLEDLNDL